MALPSDLLRRPTSEAVRRVALERLAAMAEPAARLADPADEQALHDVRVALRRLRSALRVYRPWLKDSVRGRDRRSLARLQEHTGAGRDAEACLERLPELATGLPPATERGRRWFAERLGAAARAGRKDLEARFARWLARRGERLARRLRRYAVPLDPESAVAGAFASDLAALLRSQAASFLAGLSRLADPAHADEAHGVRIEGKRLRYLLEPFVGLLPGVEPALRLLKQAQEDLGALQDLVVLQDLLADALEAAAVEHARRLSARARGAAGAKARARDEVRPGLLALARAAEEARLAHWEALRGTWCRGDKPAAVAASLEGLAHAAQVQTGVEIERKYLLSALPPALPADEVLEVEQGWLPGEALQERVRRVRRGSEVACWRTLKLGRGVTRTEIEEQIPEALFERLWPLTEGIRVRKRRHVVADGALTWEIDEFLDRDLVLAEVELTDPAQPVPVPGWLAPCLVREVTEEDAYVNRRLAR